MTIYTVVKFYSMSDHESWQHWTGESLVSYHQSVQGAEDRIKELLLLDEQIELDCIPLNPHTPQEYWDERIEEIRANTQSIAQGSAQYNEVTDKYEYKYEETPRYSIRSIEVEP